MLLELNAYSDIAHKIEQFASQNNTDYIDAIVTYCHQNNLEIEVVGDIISQVPTLKLKIEIEAEALHFLKPTPRLPL